MFPVEDKIGEIRAALAANSPLVLTAPPGSGKTTCVAPALLGEKWLAGKKIVMLEPRRLAARMSAGYIASRLGEEPGGTVGYHVRLERKVSAATRLEIVTEGLLAQRLLADPELSGVGLVIFDEFHERSLACDLAFALVRETRGAYRPDLRVAVMSATLDVDAVASALPGAAVVHAEGRMFHVETKYLGDVSVERGVLRALRETDGDILAFLPGEGEIRRAAESLSAQGLDAAILPLYGALPKEEQDAVFAPIGRRKVILATSIAETSLTIPGIKCVVDSGLMRVPRFSPSTGMSALVTLPLSRDRAEQRRGRAGRVAPGVCYRLWDEAAERNRPERMTPEILEADLAPTLLASAAWGAPGRLDLPWVTPPAAAAWEQAKGALASLGALDSNGRLTAKGEAMSRLPMHPRLANMLLGGGRRNLDTASVLAAILEEGTKSRETDIRKIVPGKRVLRLASRFAAAASRAVKSEGEIMDEGALLALAYPDRVAKGRGNGTFRMASGRGAAFDLSDPMARERFIVCCELDDRPGDAKAFLACPIAESDIERLFADDIREEPFCEWDARSEAVKCTVRRKLGEMVIEERYARDAADPSAIASALLEGIGKKGVSNLPCWTKETLQARDRLRFLRRHFAAKGVEWPDVSDAAIFAALEGFLGGMAKWKDLEKLDLMRVFDFMMAECGHDRRELDALAPVAITVPSSSRIRIDYSGAEPSAEVRLQECFGMMESPKVALGEVPVVMSLLSPAMRPVQITKDLAGFWRESYAMVRSEMRGRYPKHYWPEDPFSAVATRRTVKRG